nr:MAG TPA: penicillin-binding protein [Caudoviricetes sp.]
MIYSNTRLQNPSILGIFKYIANQKYEHDRFESHHSHHLSPAQRLALRESLFFNSPTDSPTFIFSPSPKAP